MCVDRIPSDQSPRPANFRLCKVSGRITELLEIKAENPTLHVLFIPGNPGIVTFYKEFIESLYRLLEGAASVTAIGHISHSSKDYEHGRLFSLQEQIDHKMDFMDHELKNHELPLILVGHSIGSYMSIEMFKRAPDKVLYCIGLYPFLALNSKSLQQIAVGKLAESQVLSVTVSLLVALLGLIPTWGSRFIVKRTLGKSWSATAVGATCSHLVKYHTVRNMLFLAMTEFKKLVETPDWDLMRSKQGQLAFLFGIDDHWGPLTMFEEISKQAPGIALSIEEEGHTHAFSCTEAGALWVAQHVARLIKDHVSRM